MTNFCKTEIKIQVYFPATATTEPRTIEALVLGAMAVHQQYHLSADNRMYVVTHIPSGRMVQTGMTRKEALAFAQALDPFDARWLLASGGSTRDLPVEDRRALAAKRQAARLNVLGML